jgi:predicted acylesterase/phospholipase RssA
VAVKKMSTIQLAFQGGGAKLVAMLPIAEAFLKAEQNHIINISRVAGTSAGSICAAMIALKSDFALARQHIILCGPTHLAALVPQDAAEARATLAKDKWPWYVLALTHRKLIVRTIKSGEPIFNSNAIDAMLRGVLNIRPDNPPPTFNKLSRELFVISSNIAESRSTEHCSGDIIEAIKSSCSLPFLLRSFKDLSATHDVDGGLCDNLPVDCLRERSNDPVFAIYPEEAIGASSIDNAFKYLMALFSASINHNVSRSIAYVQEPFRFAAHSDFGMLDFGIALEKLADDNWYNARRDAAYLRIERFFRSTGAPLQPHESIVANVHDAALYKSALARLARRSAKAFEPKRASLHAKVTCMDKNLSEADERTRSPDIITRLTDYKVLRDGARYLEATVGQTKENAIIPTRWSIWHKLEKRHLKIAALPMDKVESSSGRRTNCLIEITDPISLEKGQEISLRSSYYTEPGADLKELNRGKSEFIALENIHDYEIECGEISVTYPVVLGAITLVEVPEKSSNIDFARVRIDKSASAPHGDECTTTITIAPFPAKAVLYADVYLRGE